MAAVVEFYSEPFTQTSGDRLRNALTAYLELIDSPEAAFADIMVFPEFSLNSIPQTIGIPEPEDLIAPCGNDSFHMALQSLSCSALRTQKYLVINLTEEKVTKDNGTLYYNANVVFDRQGRVISRYRKFNLFGESGISITDTPDISTFTTDFNVTFGHFICFDVLFKTPAMSLMKNPLVTDIVYPTMWFSELPFLTAVQTQVMWAHKNQVNFLAAGAGNPMSGSTGSGIFSRDGPIKTIMSGNKLRKVFVAEVPKKEFWDDPEVKGKFGLIENDVPQNEELIAMKRDHLDVYKSKFLDFTRKNSHSEDLCFDDTCCHFEVTGRRQSIEKDAKSYKHFLVAFDGVRTYDGFATGGVFTCALISCLNETLASCGRRFDPTETVGHEVVFDLIEITGTFRDTEDQLNLGNTLDHQLQSLPFDSFEYKESRNANK